MKVTQPQPKFFPLRFFLIILSFFFSALALANTPIDTLRIRSILLKNIPPVTLIAQDDTYTVTTSSEKQYVGSVFDNDRWGTSTPTDETVQLFAVSGTADNKGDLVLRTATKGRILVPAHTPIGTYQLLYQICDRKIRKHCQTATVTVIILPKTVSPTTQTPTITTGTTQTPTVSSPTTLIAQDDTYTVTTSSEKQYVGSVFDNDRWGTTTPTDETVRLFAVSGTTDSNGDKVLRTATKGRILVPAHTPAGTYELLYRICDRKFHKHCQTATVTVIVLPKTVSPTTQTPTTTTSTTQTPTTVTPTAQTNTTVTPTTLIAQDDTYTITTSSEKQYVGSVFDNDRWGTITPTDETVRLLAVSGTTDNKGDLVLRTTSKGRILVPAHTPAGTYELLYRICDRKFRKHCQTATVTVIVLPKVETPTTTTSSTQTNTTQTPTTSTPTTQTPTTATPTTLIAQDDTYTITTSSEKQYVGSVFDNDRWGTTTPTDETVGLFAVSGTTDSNGDLVLRTASEGRILIPAYTPVGTYQLLYRICDRKERYLCQTATVTVIVLPKTVSPTTQTPTTTTGTTQTTTTVTPTTQTPRVSSPTTLIAQDDTYTVTTSSEKQYVGSVFDNDRWGTTTPTDETVQLFAVSGTTDSNGDKVLRTATKGRILIPAHTPVGTYKLLYRICDRKERNLCQTATVTVIVLPKTVSPTTQIPTTNTSTTQTNTTQTPTTSTPTTLIAQDDTYTVTTSSEKQYVGSVFDNDRWGTTTPTDETVGLFAVSGTTDSNGDLVLRTASKGRILVPAHTPVGTYKLLYQICEQKLRKHCQTATVTVIVLPKVVSPSTQTSTTVTPTAQTNTTVTPTTLIAQDDTYTITTSSEKQYVGSVFDNDRWGTTTPTDETVRLFAVSGTTDSNRDLVLRTASEGRILVPAHTPAGTYELLYRICDRKFHKHCQTATVTVIVLQKVVSPTTQTPTVSTPTTQTNTTVTPTTLIAQDDTYTVTTSSEKQYVGSVFDNDRWGTTTPTDETVGLFAVSGTTDSNGDLVLRTASEGRILVPAHTPVGTYELLYRICDRKIHKHCQTATVTIIVLPKTVSPTTKTPTTTTGTTQTTTVTPTTQTNTTVTPTTLIVQDDTYTVTTSSEKQYVGSVFDNDRWGTTTPTDETFGLFAVSGTTDSNGDLVLKTASEGRILIPAYTPVGTYKLLYQICEQKLRKHCQTATVTVIVLPKVETPTTTTSTTQTNTTVTPTTQTNTTVTPTTLIAQDDTYTVTTSLEKQYVGSVFDNDRWGTTTPTDETVGLFAVSGTTDNKGDLVLRTASEGRVLVPAHTPVGTYELLYRICDRKDYTLCQTATVTVIVLPKTVSPTTQTNTTTTSTTETSTTITPTTQTNTTVTPTTLIAQDDTYTVTTSSEKQYVGSVFDNDRWGTTTPTDETVGLFAVSGTTDSKGDLVLRTASKGRILVPAHTPVGTYQLLYRICDQKIHKHCQTATVRVIVLPKIVSPTTQTNTTTTGTTQTATTVTPTTLITQDDTYTVTTSSEKQYVGSVFDNDRWGTTTPTDETVGLFAVSGTTDSNGDLVLRTASKGRILVPAHTPVGTYQLLYRICDRKIRKHCQTATVKVIVLPKTVSPTTETPTTNTSTTQTPTTVTPTTQTNTTVTSTTLIAQDDTYTVTTSSKKQYVGSVFDNDRWGTTTPTDETIQLFAVSGTTDSNGDLVLRTASKGRILVPAHTAVKTYQLLYRICDRKFHKHCQTATVTVIVLPKVVSPTTQTPTTTTSTTQTNTTVTPTTQTNTTQTETSQEPIAVSDNVITTMNIPIRISILNNDTPYNAIPIIISIPLKGTAILNEDNTISYQPNTNFIGIDSFVYKLCGLSPKQCSSATVTIKVTHKIEIYNGISANNDSKNDYLHILGIENYPNNKVVIFSKDAEKVFECTHYDNVTNVFRGNYKESTKTLPSNTYFYFIEYEDEELQTQKLKGWLYLKH